MPSKTTIRSLADVNDSSLSDVFAEFYGDPGARAEIQGEYGALLSGAANDNYNSEVKKLRVRVTRSSGEEREVNIVFKVPVQSLFLRRTQKVSRCGLFIISFNVDSVFTENSLCII